MSLEVGSQISDMATVSGGKLVLSAFPAMAPVSIPGLVQVAELAGPGNFVVDYVRALVYVDPTLEGSVFSITYTVGSEILSAKSLEQVVFDLQRQLDQLQEMAMRPGTMVMLFTATGLVQALDQVSEYPVKAITSAYLIDNSGVVQPNVFQVVDVSHSAGPFNDGAVWRDASEIFASIPAGLLVAHYKLIVLYLY